MGEIRSIRGCVESIENRTEILVMNERICGESKQCSML